MVKEAPMKRLLLLGGLFVFSSQAVWAQSPAAQPQPGPEHGRLAYLIGTWKIEGEQKASPPDDPGGPISGTTACEWYDGHFFVICRSDMTAPSFKQLEIFGYSPKDAAYTRYFINNMGNGSLDANGKVSGKTWEWNSDLKEDGKALHERGVVTEVSPDSWISKASVTIDGGPAKETYEINATRIK